MELQQAGERMESQEISIRKNRQAIKELEAEVATLGQDAVTHSQRLKELDERIQKIPALRKKLQWLEGQHAADALQLDALREQILSLEKLTEEERARLDTIEKILGITPSP